MGGSLGGFKQSVECSVEGTVEPPQPPSVEESKPMSTPQKQAEKTQSDAKATDPPPDQPAPESTEAEGVAEEEEEEGECGFCLFMKGGGCKDAFVSWEDCVKEAEEKKEDLVEKCSQVTDLLKQCMDAHSDYYEPILRAEKHAEEQVIIELEKEKRDSEKRDSAPNNNEQEEEAPSLYRCSNSIGCPFSS